MSELISEGHVQKWWQGAVFYQIYPRSFFDSNGDGIGDLKGITEKLPYVAALGVDAIWLSPFFRSPMKDFGYDVQDYRAVDSIFGKDQDFTELLAEAHRLGLKVIIDIVISHTSDQHAWFAESASSRHNPKADWYVWVDGVKEHPPNNWLAVFGGSAWQWHEGRQQYYLHNFLVEQPDLNYHCIDLQNAILQECRYWLEKGVDGFRLDVCNFYFHNLSLQDNPDKVGEEWLSKPNPYHRQSHIHDVDQPETIDFLRRLRALCDEFNERFLVAEIFSDRNLEITRKYIGEPGPLHSAYNFELLSEKLLPGQLQKVIQGFFSEAPRGWPAWAFDNHDIARVATRWNQGLDHELLAKTFIVLLTSLPGISFLYQGEELGLPESEVPFEKMCDPYGLAFYPEFKGRDGCRTPMPWNTKVHAGFTTGTPWLPVDERHRRQSIEQQVDNSQSVLSFARQWLAWRREQAAFRGVDFIFHADQNGLIVLERKSHSQRILVVANTAVSSIKVLLPPGHWQEQPPFCYGYDLRDDSMQISAGGLAVLLQVT